MIKVQQELTERLGLREPISLGLWKGLQSKCLALNTTSIIEY